MQQDKDARKYAVPSRGSIWGMNYNDRSERDIGARDSVVYNGGNDFADFFPTYLISNPSSTINPTLGIRKQCPIRILQPHYGEITECYVDININVAAADSDLTLKIAIGRFEAGSCNRVMEYLDDDINSSWLRIRGSNEPLRVNNGVISTSILDLLPALPKFGNSNYMDDAFVLILSFNKLPTISGLFKFNFMNIHSSITGAI